MNIFELLQNTKTTRRNEFTDNPVSEDKIENIKHIVLNTANASNRQSYSIIILDKVQMKTLNLPGSKAFVFCVDFYRLQKCADHLEKQFDSEYLLQFITALIDISMLLQSTLLAANELEIDTLVTNEIYHKKLDDVFELLNLPEHYVFPMLALCLGYSANKSKPKKRRLNPKFIFHENQYNSQQSIDKIIKEYDKENMGLIKDWNEKGYNHYLEWFFEKWSPIIGSRKENALLISKLKEYKII